VNYAVVALVAFLALYSLVAAAFAFNLRGVSDWAANSYRGYSKPLRLFGADTPAYWRFAGAAMLLVGVIMLAWIFLQLR
jgi:hypothetical protein